MKLAHQGRLSRLQSLQSANNILKEQIETYEENEKSVLNIPFSFSIILKY